MTDKLSRYLKHLDGQDQEEMEETDYALKLLLLKGMQFNRPKPKK